MSINFTRLFTTLGKLCGGLNEVNTFLGTTIPARATTLLTQFDGLAVYAPLVSTIPQTEAQEQGGSTAWVSMLSSFATSSIIDETIAANPLVNPSFANCLAELVREMTISSITVASAQCQQTLASIGSPTGDESFVISLLNPYVAVSSDYVIPDVILITCSQDSSHGATEWQEVFTFAGLPGVSPATNYAYGTAGFGAGTLTAINATDPAVEGGLVTDPAFLSWGTGGSSNVPQDWSIYSGTAGTNVFQISGHEPRGAANPVIELVGDGSTVVKVRQEVTVVPGSSYALNFRTFMVTDETGHWVISVSLTNSTGSAVTGPGSYSNVVTSTSSATLPASWGTSNVFTGTFVAPTVIPTGGVFLEIRLALSSSLTSPAPASSAAYVDYCSLVQETPLYAGGPSYVLFSGITAPVQGDARTSTIVLNTSTGGSTSITGSLLRGIDRLTGGLAQYAPTFLPSVTSAATESNSLVV